MRQTDVEQEELSYKVKPHYVKNKKKSIDLESLDDDSTDLMFKKIDNKIVFGFIKKQKDKIISCKFDKDTSIYVEFIGNKKILYKPFTFRDYTIEKSINYFDEL